MMRLGVLISGRGSNLHALLDAKEKGALPEAEFAVVFSNKEDAPGLQYGLENNILTACVPSKEFRGNREKYDQRVLETMETYSCDGLVLAGYMRIITPILLNAFPNKIINIHPSLLPSFPGLHAQRQALEWGVKHSGCTVHLVDEGVDSGPIITQRQVPVLPNDTEDTLSERILEQEHQAIVEGVKIFTEKKHRIEGRRFIVES